MSYVLNLSLTFLFFSRMEEHLVFPPEDYIKTESGKHGNCFYFYRQIIFLDLYHYYYYLPRLASSVSNSTVINEGPAEEGS